MGLYVEIIGNSVKRPGKYKMLKYLIVFSAKRLQNKKNSYEMLFFRKNNYNCLQRGIVEHRTLPYFFA